jgi:quinol monooxygenase YgiN
VLTVLVEVHVVADGVQAFREASEKNARASRREPGIARFDVLQRKDDPTRFVLVEVYRDEQAPSAHKQTAHYLAWRDAVAPLMASPRVGHHYDDVVPA